MPQHFRLDRLSRFLYLCLMAACAKPAASIAPRAMPSMSAQEAGRWAEATAPTGHQVTRFRWLFNNGEASVGGLGSARVAGPDSMRFDIAGPWGIGGAAAMVIGDGPGGCSRPTIIAQLIPSYPLMWAMFGVMRPPPPGARVRGTQQGGRTALEWVQGADTVRYAWLASGPGTVQAQWQRAGITMGLVETRLDADGAPVSARLTVPSVPARLDLTIVADSSAPPFPPSVWAPPAP